MESGSLARVSTDCSCEYGTDRLLLSQQCSCIARWIGLVLAHWNYGRDIVIFGDRYSCVPFSASEMTYIVSGGALNSTHSLTHLCAFLAL